MSEMNLLNRLGSKLETLLTDDGAAPSPGKTQPTSERHLQQDEFEAHLKTMLKGDSKPLTGRVNFIARSSATAGPKWQSVPTTSRARRSSAG
jgi:hypothetical protein